MSQPIPTRHGNPCQVCGDITGDCRQGADDPDYFMCMAHAGTRQGEIINGHVCLGDASNHLWGQFKLDSGKAKTPRSTVIIKPKQKAARKLSSLSLEGRNNAIRILHAYHGLSEKHAEDLRSRGLTDHQIRCQLYFSITPDREVPSEIPADLPGIKDGRIKAAGPGYACVSFDFQGRATGWQIRLDNVTTNKYRWSKSDESSHLPNGELPISSVYPDEIKHQGIWICEGVSKPAIAAHRLGIVAIGAASGNFAISPQQVEDHLKVAAERLGTKRVILAPDGGATGNHGVIGAYERSWELFRDLGYQVEVAWWNQLNKSDPDIDELENLTNVEYLSVSKFSAIAKAQQKEATKAAKEESKKKSKLEKKAEQERLQQLRLEATEQLYRDLTTIKETPWVTICQKELDFSDLGGKELEPGAIYVVASAKGSGKTKASKPVVMQHEAVLGLFARLSLMESQAKQFGVPTKNQNPESKRLFTTVNSIIQYEPSRLRRKGIVYLDEFDQLMSHAFGSTCNKDGMRPAILAHLRHCIRAAVQGNGMVLAMSADIAQPEIDYLKEVAPRGCPVRLILNTYQPDQCEVIFDESDTPDAQLEDLIADLKKGTPVFAVDDFLDGCRGAANLAEYVRLRCPELSEKIIEINSRTVTNPEVIDFIKDINTASEKYMLISCSPAVVSGISIENGRFVDGVYSFANGILPTGETLQAVARPRGVKKIRSWAAKKGVNFYGNREGDPRELKDYLFRNYKSNAKYLSTFLPEYDPLNDEWNSPHLDLMLKKGAVQNLQMQDYRARLKKRLEEEGYKVKSIERDDPGIEEILQDLSARIDINRAEDVAAARILDDDERRLLEEQVKKRNLTPEEQNNLQKTYLYNTFGEQVIERVTVTKKVGNDNIVLTGYAAVALRDKRGRLRKGLDAFYLLQSDISEAIARDHAREQKQLQHGDRFVGDITWLTRQRQCREYLGLPEYLDPNKWWGCADVMRIANKAKEHGLHVKDALGFSVENISGGQIFAELMNQIGLELETTGKRGEKKRKITSESWQLAQLFVEYKVQKKLEKEELEKTREAEKLAESEAENIDQDAKKALSECHSQKHIVSTTTWLMIDDDRRYSLTDIRKLAATLDTLESRQRVNALLDEMQIDQVKNAIEGLGLDSLNLEEILV